ncbi:MAG: hypothetical protein M1136_12655 [Chloroflexi bacterium]|nr:hypothetical protein [Chloroflexota bacterium]MCL5076474.1 hypothetical protein [Chloroflexota bacterium]
MKSLSLLLLILLTIAGILSLGLFSAGACKFLGREPALVYAQGELGSFIAMVKLSGTRGQTNFGSNIYMMPGGGGQAVQITPFTAPILAFDPAWSADRTRVAFSSNYDAALTLAERNIMVMDAGRD